MDYHPEPVRPMVAGVCTRLGSSFNIDPTLIRVGWVILGLVNWVAAVGVYVAAAVILPGGSFLKDSRRNIGLLLVGGGLVLLTWNLGGKAWWAWVQALNLWKIGFWPLVLIGVGIILVIGKRKKHY